MTYQFDDPATGGGDHFSTSELNGALLLIEVKSLEESIPTKYGPSDAIKADVTVLDGPQKGETLTDCLIFPRVLRSALAPNVGKTVLGRLGQGVAKPGQNAPWTLTPGTDTDKETASRYLTWRAQQEQATVPPAPAPQPQPQPAAARAETPW